MERLSGDLSWWKRGFGWGKSYLLEGGPVQQRLNTIITQMDWASWHPQLWNNTFWAQGVPLSPGFGEFSSGNFLRGGGGWNLSSFICLCVSQKHWEGSWAGTCGALSFPTQGLVSQHPLGLASPWRADDAEFLVRCTNSYPASCWP